MAWKTGGANSAAPSTSAESVEDAGGAGVSNQNNRKRKAEDESIDIDSV